MKKGYSVVLMLATAMIMSCGNGQQKTDAGQQAYEDSLRQDSVMRVEAAKEKADSIRQDSIIAATVFKGTFKAKGGDLGDIKIDLYNPTVKCVTVYECDPYGENIEYGMGNVSIGAEMMFHAKGHMGDVEEKVSPIKIDGKKAVFGVTSACESLNTTLELTYVEGDKYILRAIGDNPFCDVNSGKMLPKEIELEKVE